MIVAWLYRDSSMTPPLLEALFNKNFKETNFVFKKIGTLAPAMHMCFQGSSTLEGNILSDMRLKLHARVKLAISKKRLARGYLQRMV